MKLILCVMYIFRKSTCRFVIGEYRIGLKFNDEHIPDSPFKVYISPAVGDAHLLEVAQFPEGSIQADKPAQFIVRRNGAKGDLDAKVGSLYLKLFSLFVIIHILLFSIISY